MIAGYQHFLLFPHYFLLFRTLSSVNALKMYQSETWPFVKKLQGQWKLVDVGKSLWSVDAL